jgi:signal peptidase I
MEPTLHVGEIVYTDGTHFKLGVDDVVIFHPPAGALGSGLGTCGTAFAASEMCPEPTSKAAGIVYIKRVVAVGGDRIALVNGQVIRNGERQVEPFASVKRCGGSPFCNFPQTITIPHGFVFLLGDNRDNSDDSRFWGPVRTTWIVGRVETCSAEQSSCRYLN